ncbi:MAG: sulfide/dihydroorotate dehydrogenase-like FAD/NAD-binding protein, partial [Candidatus Izemoplasmatales bacterium]|nr:sulfide/dihydroorotate dehydrogenase-like FAD/NAD-binding protein [Candidatus Izemoplasmatales bacterium]
MFKIVLKTILTPSVSLMKIYAPNVVKHAKPGQFIVLRTDSDSERIPFTIAEANQDDQTIAIIFQVVGASTLK